MSRLFRGRRLLQRALWEQAQQAGFTTGSKVQVDGHQGAMATAGGRRS